MKKIENLKISKSIIHSFIYLYMYTVHYHLNFNLNIKYMVHHFILLKFENYT